MKNDLKKEREFSINAVITEGQIARKNLFLQGDFKNMRKNFKKSQKKSQKSQKSLEKSHNI